MIVCIAEKPSVAKDIARIIGATTSHDGYMEGNGYQVTWTFGHLCELKMPEDYTPVWKSWSLSALPMIPPKFGIRLKDDEGIKKQFATIERLMSKADSIINCGDAGQEGELIQRWVMQKAQAKCPVQGDWLLGINCTRLYTIKYGQNRQVLSIGRVQTPTLALIVNRQKEIDNFKPEPYWVLATVYRDTTFTATSGKFTSKEEGEQAFATIEGKPFEVTKVEKKNGKEVPPSLYDLTSLQVDCNKKYGFSAEMTLNLIQQLYEQKLTTYPRVDTTFLPDDVYGKCPQTMNGLFQVKFAGQSPYAELVRPLGGKPLLKSKKVFDSSKVTDHHAIIPTGIVPQNLTDLQRKVYDLIARRFIAVFYPDCKYAQTTVLGEVRSAATESQPTEQTVEFKVTGRTILDAGWRAVYAKDTQTDDEDKKPDEEERTLPDFQKGEKGPHTPTLTEKMTTPPKFYTEATLLRAMETAGKLVEDEELRRAMKENGIGRPSTRAAIIETLFKRRYIKKERKNLVATPTGIELIDLIREELLKSAELTGIWEKKLRDIEAEKYDPKQFLDELKQQVSDIVMQVMGDQSNRRVPIEVEQPKADNKSKAKGETKKPRTSRKKKTEQSAAPTDPLIGKPCPVCGQGTIIKGKTAYGCSRWKEGCTFRQPIEDK